MAIQDTTTGRVWSDEQVEEMRRELQEKLNVDLKDMSPKSVVANYLTKKAQGFLRDKA